VSTAIKAGEHLKSVRVDIMGVGKSITLESGYASLLPPPFGSLVFPIVFPLRRGVDPRCQYYFDSRTSGMDFRPKGWILSSRRRVMG
jgi:hypothetical protein